MSSALDPQGVPGLWARSVATPNGSALRHPRRLVLAVLSFSCAMAGCSPGGVERARFSVQDSAGVRIVQSSAPLWEGREAWSIDSTPSLVLGGTADDEGALLLHWANQIVGLSEGHRWAVMNEGTDQVLLFDSLGAFERAFGRPGDGPGEFRFLSGIYRCDGDTLVVDEERRLSLWDSEGRFVRSSVPHTVATTGVLFMHAVSEDCTRILYREQFDSRPEAGRVGQLTATLIWEDLSTLELDTVVSFRFRETGGGVLNGRAVGLAVPWGRTADWAVGGDRIYLGLSDTTEIRVLNLSGAMTEIIRWAGDQRSVTSTERGRYASKRSAYLQRHPHPLTRQATVELGAFPVPDKAPAYSRLLLDDAGNLWVREYPGFTVGMPHLFRWEPGDGPVEWNVFDRAGRWLGPVEVPGAFEVRGFSAGRMIAMWKDDLDVEHIGFFGIDKPGGR